MIENWNIRKGKDKYKPINVLSSTVDEWLGGLGTHQKINLDVTSLLFQGWQKIEILSRTCLFIYFELCTVVEYYSCRF